MKTSPLFLLALLPLVGGCNKDQTDDPVETGIDTGETGNDTGEKGGKHGPVSGVFEPR